MRISDWSSDVCSSDLPAFQAAFGGGGQRLDAIEADDFGLDAAGRRGAGVSERGHRQLLRRGREDFGRFYAAFPTGNVEWFDPDVGKAEHLQPRGHPVAGAGFGRAARKAGADIGRQPRSEEHTSELQSLMRISY